MMQKTIGVTELQQGFGVILDEVAEQKTPYILTRNSQPKAVLIPYPEYLRYRRLQDSDLRQRVDDLLLRMAERNRNFTEDEIAADVEMAVQEVRAESAL